MKPLPCPYPDCGGVPEDVKLDGTKSGLRWVKCTHCTTYGPNKNSDAEAIAAWNSFPRLSQVSSRPWWDIKVGDVVIGETIEVMISREAEWGRRELRKSSIVDFYEGQRKVVGVCEDIWKADFQGKKFFVENIKEGILLLNSYPHGKKVRRFMFWRPCFSIASLTPEVVVPVGDSKVRRIEMKRKL